MANELTIRGLMAFVKGDVDEKMTLSFTKTITGTKCLKNTQSVGTSAELLELGDITTPGYMIYYNTDATNYIEVRDGETGADVIKMAPDSGGIFQLTTATPWVIANTAACVLQYMVIEV